MSNGTHDSYIYLASFVMHVLTAVCAAGLLLSCATAGFRDHAAEGAAEQLPAEDRFFAERFDYRIAPWRGFARAACSVTLDDGTLDQYLLAFPEFEKRDIRATYFLITGPREEGVWQDGPHRRMLFSWDHAKILASAGHEIASHGVSHADLTRNESEAERELRNSEAAIRARIPSLPPGMTFSWPYWRSTRTLRRKASGYYLGARTGTVDFKRYANFGVDFHGGDVYPRDLYRIEAIALRSEDSIEEIRALGNRSYEQGRWLLIDLHGVDDGRLPQEALGWEPIPLERLKEMLDYIRHRGYWIAPFGEVLRYVRQRESAKLSFLYLSRDTLYLSFDDGLADHIYDQPLTIRLRLPRGWKQVGIYKDERLISQSATSDGFLTCDLRPDGRLIRVLRKGSTQ